MKTKESTLEIASTQLVGRYVPSSQWYQAGAPTLADSLSIFDTTEAFQELAKRTGYHLDCLIQGYTAPGNATALTRTIKQYVTASVGIIAVDQLDLPGIYSELGLAMPEMGFLQADACDLGERLAGRRFDLIIQDFILNCLPPIYAPSLLGEARRHLKPNGVCLISVSTDAAPLNSSTKMAPSAQGLDIWANGARGVWDLKASQDESYTMESSLCHQLIGDISGRMIQIAQPSGHFEFFYPMPEVIGMIEAAGFSVAVADIETAVDYNGIACKRCRLIAKPL